MVCSVLPACQAPCIALYIYVFTEWKRIRLVFLQPLECWPLSDSVGRNLMDWLSVLGDHPLQKLTVATCMLSNPAFYLNQDNGQRDHTGQGSNQATFISVRFPGLAGN